MQFAFVTIVRDINRLDAVFSVLDSLVAANPEVTQELIEHYRRDPDGARALRDRPRIGRIDVHELRKLAPGTLGREFAEHMIANRLDPSALPDRPSRTEIEFFVAHGYETHDVWHVVTGFGTDVAGELALQAFYAAQTPRGPFPVTIIAAGLLNAARSNRPDLPPRLEAFTRGYQMGLRARMLFGIDWKTLWATPLVEIRARYGIDTGNEATTSVSAPSANESRRRAIDAHAP
jgi:ubiquinone biosynthesis protein Coq4